MKRVWIILFSVAIVAGISCSGETRVSVNTVNTANTTNSSTPAQSPLPAATIDELASGRKVYWVSCQNCHKEDGTGGPMEIEGKKIDPDDLTSAKIKGCSDEKILRYVMNGVPDEGMPAFKGKLSEGEMRDVVKFVRTELQGMPINTNANAGTNPSADATKP